MKRLYTFAAVAAILTAVSCNQEPQIVVQNPPAIDVTNQKLDPNTNESGTVRAYAGTQVTAKGLNLDRVGSVKIDGKDATIVSKEMKTLVFEIPVLDKPQQDDPYRVDLEVFEDGTDKLFFKYDYFVTVPVTDALVTGMAPKAGTIGTEVTISGRNLEQITSVSFGSTSVAVADFVSSASAAVVVAVPAVSVTEANTQLDGKAVWSGGTIALEDKFALSVPVFTAYSQAAPALLGDEFALTGSNRDLVKAVKWGDMDFLISDQNATSITVKVPTGIELQNPAIQDKALTAIHGVKGDQVITVASSFKVDTTPVGPAAPVFTSAAPSDNAYTAIFLGKEVTVKGQNFASIEKFRIDGIEATLTEAATDIEAKFIVPSTITGTAAKEVTLEAIWNGGNVADFGTVTVYPFYYYKGLRIGIGSNSKNTYPEYNGQNAFILLDEGRVVSVDEFRTTPVDAFAMSGTNTVTSAANKVTGAEADYYSVQPYLFAISNSSNKLSFCDPANTANQLKCHFYDNGGALTALPTTFGTPVMFMAVLKEADSGELKAAVAGGTLTDIATTTPKASAGAPAFGTSEGSTWVKGSVITMQYVNYEYASQGTKPGDGLAGVRKVGYVYIRDITCGDETTGLAKADRVGYIEMDIYWSNVL